MSVISQVNFATETDSDAFNAGRRALLEAYFPEEDSEDRGTWNARFNSLLPPSLLIQPSSRPAHFRASYALLNNTAALLHSIATTADPTALVIDAELMKASTDGTGDAPAFGVGAGSVVNHAGALVASQATLGHRPLRARRPRTGVRNRFLFNAADVSTGWAVVNQSGGAGVLTLVDDTAAIAALGLPAGVRAYRLDNSAGTGTSTLTSGGAGQTFSSLADFNMSVFIRSESGPLSGYILRTGFGGYPALPAITTSYVRYNRNRSERIAGSENAVDIFWLQVPAGAVVLIVLPQNEAGLTMTAPQAVRANGLDITEAGVRSVTDFAFDGIAQRMALASAFNPAGDFGLIAAHNSTGQAILGAPVIRFFRGSLHVESSSNCTDWLPNPAGPEVVAVNSIGAGAAVAWGNGALRTSTLFGSMRPIRAGGFTTFGSDGTSFLSGRVSALVGLRAGAMTTATREALQRVLAARTGVTLA